jgi:hypothetical protein
MCYAKGKNMSAPRTTALILGATAAGIVLTSMVLSLLIASQTFSNTGNIKAVGIQVYADAQCSTPLSSVNWDVLEAGKAKNFTVYLRNNGTVPVQLSMTTRNWNPTTAVNYLRLVWNCTGYVVPQSARVTARLTLSAFSNATAIQSFAFEILLTGTEH